MNKILGYGTCLLLLLFSLPSIAKQKIVVIESYHSGFSWDESYKKGIQSVLKDDFDIFHFQMDTKRIPEYAFEEQANKAWDFYQQVEPDLVILGDDNALKYLGVRFSKTEIPVIYLGINNNPRNYNIHQSKNISGVLERPLIKRAIPSMTQLLPQKVRRVLVLFDNSPTSHIVLQEVFSARTQMTISAIEVQIRLIGDWETWQKTVQSAADEQYDAIFFGLYQTIKDSSGKHIPASQVIDWSGKNTPIAPFALWDFSVGAGKAIGGLVLFGYEQGKLAAQMAKEVLLTGKQPYQLGPKTAEKGRYLFSRQALQKYGLTLPEKIAKKATLID